MQLRRLLIWLHLAFASFTLPFLLLVAVTGALYVNGSKGSVSSAAIELPSGTSLDMKSDSLKADVKTLLKAQGVDVRVQKLKISGNTIITRPSSEPYAELKVSSTGVEGKLQTPDLHRKLVELHKGHGPKAFKLYQTLAAITLIFVSLGGVLIGLLMPAYRNYTIGLTTLGTIIMLVIGFML